MWEEIDTFPTDEKVKIQILYRYRQNYLRMMTAWWIPKVQSFRLLNNRTYINHGSVVLWRVLED